jgi:hypothetical protein
MMRAIWLTLWRWWHVPAFDPQMSDDWQKANRYEQGKS